MSLNLGEAIQAGSCSILRQAIDKPSLLLLPLGGLVWLGYKVTHVSLVPGIPTCLTLLLPDSSQSHPHSATLSPISYLRARWAFFLYARSRGYKSSQAFADELRDDEDYDWASGERPERGSLVRGWDRIMVWDFDCIDLIVLESWRSISDVLSDALLESMGHSKQADVMLTVAQHSINVKNTKELQPEADLIDFWDSVNRRPPRGSGAVGLKWYMEKGLLSNQEYESRAKCDIDENFSRFSTFRGDEHIKPTIEELQEEANILQRGKDMFYRYGPPILVGLMHVGLSGGFASPRITDVLRSTGYLMSAKKKRSGNGDAAERLRNNVDTMKEAMEKEGERDQEDTESTLPSDATKERTFRRLLETMSFVLDAMESADSLSPPCSSLDDDDIPAKDGQELLNRGGQGWLSSCRVRLIHANVRRRLSTKGNKSYPSSSGIAINQEDLLATLTSFSIAPLDTLQRMGLSPSLQEREDYVALWRHVGFYMGIEPHLLERTFRDVHSAEKYFCCVASHHFLAVTHFKYTPAPPPISSRFGHDLEEVKRFNFDQGPALPLLYSVSKRPPGGMSFSTLCSMSRFLLGDALANAVSLPGMTTSQYLGVRLRLFILAFPPLFARYYPRMQFELALRENCKGLLRRVIIWSLKGEEVSFESNRDEKESNGIELGMEEGNRLRRQYFALMIEMVVVSLLAAVVAVFTSWTVFKWSSQSILKRIESHIC